MKKIFSLLLAAGFGLIQNVSAQFIPAGIPESTYPPPALGLVTSPDHVSCYGFHWNTGSMSGNFNVYSWSSAFSITAPIFGGIAYVFTDPTLLFGIRDS